MAPHSSTLAWKISWTEEPGRLQITDCDLEQNSLTGEDVYIMEIMCNDIPFSVCINKKDLLGEPAIGRRFKGIVWLQGSVYYAE